MRAITYLPLCAPFALTTAFAFAAPGAAAQELHGHDVCRQVGAFAPEPLGDRQGHALSITQDSCQTTEGPTAGAIMSSSSVLEWDGAKAKSLSAYGVARKPGATLAFQGVDGAVDVIMNDGKPTGWTASGHTLITLATGSWASLKGKTVEWASKGTGPNISETDYTFK